MRYLSLFSGIGGFELGIKQANESILNQKMRGQGETKDLPIGHSTNTGGESDERHHPTCIGFSEIDKYASKIYQSHFPEHKPYGDITKINETELPDFDLLVGGFPCQSFSIAGKRGGFSDTRGTMFFEIARILKHKQPRLFLLENVKGLLSHDEGRTFATIVTTLDELGYDLEWQVLNSKNFGVPQNRERVFIVGHLRGTSRPEVFPITGGERNDSNESEISNTLSANYWKGVGASRPFLWEEGDKPNHRNSRGGTAHTVRSGGRGSGIDKKQNWDSYLVDGKIRRLTPTECARLQGFPDHWHKVEGISDTQAYKCYGNAVTVNVIREIVKRMI